MELLDMTVVNVAIPTLQHDLGVDLGGIEWLVTGYLLSLAVFIPAAGFVADRFGSKRTFMLALAVFTTASLGAGFAWNLESLVAFRLLQGVGGGMLTPVGTAMVFLCISPRPSGDRLGVRCGAGSNRSGPRSRPRRLPRGIPESFLLLAMKRFAINEWDRANAQKRGGGETPLSLDWQDAETRFQIQPAHELSPDKLYDRAWAIVVLERVITRLRDESDAEGKASQYEQLKTFLMVGRNEIPHARVAAELQMTEGAVRVAVHRLRRRYRELLREEIAQTLADPAQADEEMQALFSALAS